LREKTKTTHAKPQRRKGVEPICVLNFEIVSEF
jgi:hypothetical protein